MIRHVFSDTKLCICTQAIPQDMQQGTEVISQPAQLYEQVVNQAQVISESEDLFEGDQSSSLDVPYRGVPDEPLSRATEEADGRSEIDRVLEGR